MPEAPPPSDKIPAPAADEKNWALAKELVTRCDVQFILLDRRVQAGPGAEKERSQQVIQSLAQVAFIIIFILPAHWPSSLFMSSAGISMPGT